MSAPDARRGDWMMTYTGQKVFPLDPRPEEINLRDIAWALAHQCRYNGHCRFFYSVAEHSVILSKTFHDAGLARQALLHDAAEAYIGDMIRPLKRFVPQFLEVEAAFESVIFARFGLPEELHPEIKARDAAILSDERAVLFDTAICDAHGWTDAPRLHVQVVGVDPGAAYLNFINRAAALGIEP